LPKIELFARQAREGWAAWGNQVSASINVIPHVVAHKGGMP
jgi:N6-adenosine-specific RNA methylase IME4